MPEGIFNGVRLFYEEAGSGDPLVLVHGSWMDHHTWDQLAPSLAERFRVVSYDRRGHSQSERPPGQGSVREDVADLAALIEDRGLAPAHIIGNSFGGSIVLRLAIDRPELARSLAVHEPPIMSLLATNPSSGSEALGESQGDVMAVIQLAASGDMEGAAHRFWDGILGPVGWEGLTAEDKKRFVNNGPTFLDEVGEPDAFALDTGPLGDVSSPALLTAGSASPPHFPAIVGGLTEAMKGACRHTFEGAGHIPHQTHANQYLDAWMSFVKDDA